MLKRICESRKLALLKSDGARLLFTWLIPNVDVNGCFSGDPEVVKGKIFTRLKKPINAVEKYLQDLHDVELILRYNISGDDYLYIINFSEHQPHINPEREGKTDIPQPTPEQLKSNSGVTPPQVKIEVKVKVKDKGKYSEPFLFFWKVFKGRWSEGKSGYVKVGKSLAWGQWKKLSLDDKRTAAAAASRVSGKYTPDPWRWLRDRKFEDYNVKGVPDN